MADPLDLAPPGFVEWHRLAAFFGDQRKRAFTALLNCPPEELPAKRAALQVWLSMESLPDTLVAWEAQRKAAADALAKAAHPGGDDARADRAAGHRAARP